MTEDVLDDPRDEYAVDTFPDREHVDTVLADGFRGALVNALAEHPEAIDRSDLYAIHHMPTGKELRLDITDTIREEISDRL